MSNEATFFTTASGRVVDLFRPEASDVDFADVAEQLAKEPRYSGATPGVVYSVAQHSVLGADWILQRGEEAPAGEGRLIAAYFLCHDFHEYVLKDETTPKKRALDAVAAEFGVLAGAISEAYARLVERWDRAIHEAAGLAWPPRQAVIDMVRDVDRRMLLAEWAALRPGHRLPVHYEGTPLPVEIAPWPWITARDVLLQRMFELLPTPRGAARAIVPAQWPAEEKLTASGKRPTDGQGTFS